MEDRKTSDGAVVVSPDNFIRAESDLYFGNVVKDGGLGKFAHNRELTPLDKQLVVRSNRDTLYSAAVFDLDAGPITISLPDPGGRFMSMQVITEDQYVPAVFYGRGRHTLTRDDVGTRYVMAVIRILVNPHDDADLDDGPRATGRCRVAARRRRQFRDPAVGSGQPEDGARRAWSTRHHNV